MKPEAAVFDLGKVLLDFDYSITARALAELCDVTAEELQATIDQTSLLLDYEAGKISTDEFYQTVCKKTGYRGAFEKFSDAFADIFSEIPEMVGLHARLKAAGVPCFIFSNTNEIAIHHIKRNFAFFGTFDGYVYSYVEKAMKPEESIYRAVERETGRSGQQLIYIDDRLENIEQGREMGWQTVHHISPAESIAAFAATGL
ncbi:MAG: HAD family hydrolase [Limisphaerales bacterium]